ncbi:hypothetical protein [Nocardia sp. NPDC004722]
MKAEAATTRIAPGEPPPSGKGDVGDDHWKVPHLFSPPQAGPALTAFIAMVDDAIQTAVRFLGHGMTEPPPQPDDPPTKVVPAGLGQGRATDAYRSTLATAEARQSALLTMDDQVFEVSAVVAAEKELTLTAIRSIVDELNQRLHAVGTAEVSRDQAITLTQQVAEALQAVYEKVANVAEDNQRMAGGGEGDTGVADRGRNGQDQQGQGAGGGEAGGAGGGGGGLGSLGSMLSMLPMAAMMGISELSKVLSSEKDRADKEKADKEQKGANNHPAPAVDPAAQGLQPQGSGQPPNVTADPKEPPAPSAPANPNAPKDVPARKPVSA